MFYRYLRINSLTQLLNSLIYPKTYNFGVTISSDSDINGKYEVQGNVSKEDLKNLDFSDLVITGDVIFENVSFDDVRITDGSHSITFKDSVVNGLEFCPEKAFEKPIEIQNSRINGLTMKGDFRCDVTVDTSRLEGMTDLSDSHYRKLSITECNCAYVRATDIEAELLDLTLSRFVQLFDLDRSRLGKAILKDSIVLETFRLPQIVDGDTMYPIVLDNITINGRVFLNLPGRTDVQKKFVRMMYEHNSSYGMMMLRMILEGNRRYYAADEAFVYQKKKERQGKDGDGDYEINGIQRFTSLLSYIISGNGMRPLVTLAWMGAVVLVFFIIYFILGTASGYDVTGTHWGDSLYLSVVSFFVCSVFDVDDLGMAFMIVENITGILMMIYFTIILTRKIIR